MSSAFKVTVPVSAEPLALADVKDYLNIDFSDKDLLLGLLISRVRAYAETVTHRALATQTIQQVFTIERPIGGDLSGPLNEGPNWYQFQEQLGANPFGPAQFYFDLAAPPVQGTEDNVTIETRVTAFAPWVTFPHTTNPDGSKNLYLDAVLEPARLYIMTPITANFYRFTYTAGYSPSYPLTPDLQQCLYEMCAYWFDNREAEDLPEALMRKLLARRVDWV